MGQTLVTDNYPSQIYSASATLKHKIWTRHWAVVADTGGITLTLPTPVHELLGKISVFANTAASAVTLSGAFISGASYSLAANSQAFVFCMKSTASVYKWFVLGDTTVSMTTEQVQDIVAAFVSANLYGLTASYDDAGNAITLTNDSAKYVKTVLTGGGATALDSISGAGLSDNDRATVIVGNNPATVYHYVLDADNGGAESSPTIISPDASAGNKRWVLADIAPAMQTYGDASALLTAIKTAVDAGTQTGITVTVTPAGNTIDFVVTSTGSYDYMRTGLTGGTANDLDGIGYSSLAAGHTAVVTVGTNPGTVYHYAWDAASAAAESSPWIIRADDDGGGAGRWVLVNLHPDMIDISDAAAKATPVDADLLLIGDSADSNHAKKSTVAEVRSSILTADGFGGIIAGLAAKATPIDADIVAIADTADTNDAKGSTVAQLRSTILAADPLGTIIAGLGAKATPIDADLLVLADTADTNDAKKSTVAELRTSLLAADPLGSVIAGLAAKATPIDADSIILCDSADTNNAKETTIAELKAVVLSADNVGSAIAGYAAKASPIDADSIVICDSADTNDAKETTIAELRTAVLAADPLGTVINGLTGKATPVDADVIPLSDSGATNDAKGLTWANLKTTVGVTDTIKTAIAGSVNWQDWAPTFAGVPAVDSTVARYQRLGNSVRGYIDIRGSDGDAWTPSTCTLPVACSDVNARIAINARQKVNAAAATDMKGYIDAETDLRMEFEGAASCTDTQAWQLYIWFEYEV